MSAPRLLVRGLQKRFGPTQALAGVDFAVQPGEIHALVGENGAGKSTLLKVLGGVHAPDDGEVRLDGQPFAPRDPAAARAAGVAVIHQELALAPHLTVAENLFLGRELRRGPFVDRAAMRTSARAALARVGRAELPPDRLVAELPPADRQLVEIARALAQHAKLLILDEPTSSLGDADVPPLLARLREVAAAGTAVVYVSHVFAELFAVASRYTVLRDGRSVGGGAMADVTTAQLVAAMVGREVAAPSARGHRRGEVVLDLDAVAGVRSPRAATLQLHAGEVLGLAGLVGAGRTELLRAVFGLDPVVRGRVRVAGSFGPTTPAQRWAQRVGLVSEDRKGEGVMLARSLAENVLLPVLSRHAVAGVLPPSRVIAAAQPFLQRLAVRCASPRQAAGELSGGNQQKLTLARLFAADCDVLLLDEPTRGIDVGARADVYAAIADRAQQGAAVLVASSQLPELLQLCDRIAVVCCGVVLPPRPVHELDESRLLAAMTGASA